MSNAFQPNYFFITGLLLAVAFVVSLMVGKYPLSAQEILAIVSGGEVADTARSVFYMLRLPRTVMAILAGLGLGMAGSVLQIIFKNPLASPDIVGVSSGANFGAALAIILFEYNAAVMASSAFLMGMLVMILVVSLAHLNRNAGAITYILAGIVVKAVTEALIMVLKSFADPEKELATMEYWAMGSLGGITASKLAAVLPFFIFGVFGLIAMRRHIALLGLDDDESRALGLRVTLMRTIILGFSALTVASSICLTGLIVFVGLNAPHVARLALKRIDFSWCVLSAMIGALILLVSDCLARSISSTEIPVSILTIFIGVPILLYFMYRRKAGTI